MRQLFLGLVLVVAACGPNTSSGDDAGGPDGGPLSCTGTGTQCSGNEYEQCQNGTWTVTQVCPNACNDSLGGCVQCDPSAGNACNGQDVVTCNADGTYGSTVTTCGGGETCAGGSCSRTCTADGVDLIYAVDINNNFLSFDPRQLGTPQGPWNLIGVLNCPAGAPFPSWPTSQPFSMSVDRNGKAWVLYTSGEIFNVDITTAACTATSFQPAQESGAWSLFGMGYSTDDPNGNTEKLYVAGGPEQPAPMGKFGYVDPTTLQIHDAPNNINVGENSPELSGTGDAKLYGYFPGNNSFVQEIDKSTGLATGTAMPAGTVAGGTPSAWAFAQWGGKFYIFVTDANGDNQVLRVDRASGTYDGQILDQTQYEVVGAGVSTCAPVVVP